MRHAVDVAMEAVGDVLDTLYRPIERAVSERDQRQGWTTGWAAVLWLWMRRRHQYS